MTKNALPKMTDDVQYARDRFREEFPHGSTVCTVVVHVPRSGMSSSVRILKGEPDGTVSDVSWIAARILGWRIDPNHGGVIVREAGENMAAHLVYRLSVVLYGGADALSHRWL